jgi:hypothetical protein
MFYQNFKRFLAFVIILICCPFYVIGSESSHDKLISSTSSFVEVDKYSSTKITDIVIAYSLYCAMYNSFKPLESNLDNPIVKLVNNIDKLPGGISTGIAFPHWTFILQNNIKGNVYGFEQMEGKSLEDSKVPYENILFVTTPIESYGMRILVILSMVRPDRTTIFSVDNNLKPVLLYDSFQKNILKGDDSWSIGSIFKIKVIYSGYFSLMERAGREEDINFSNRSFILDVTKGKFNLTQ